jgi:hypothetical protein
VKAAAMDILGLIICTLYIPEEGFATALGLII